MPACEPLSPEALMKHKCKVLFPGREDGRHKYSNMAWMALGMSVAMHVLATIEWGVLLYYVVALYRKRAALATRTPGGEEGQRRSQEGARPRAGDGARQRRGRPPRP